jgi:hypothetical protein
MSLRIVRYQSRSFGRPAYVCETPSQGSELLSRQLSYWISENKQRQQQERNQNQPFMTLRDDPNASVTSFSKTIVASLPSGLHKASVLDSNRLDKCGIRSNIDVIELEVHNLKVLCSQLLRSHKIMAKQIAACREEIRMRSPSVMNSRKSILQKKNVGEMDGVLRELQEQQKHHFFRQLISLDMKEKAFEARVRRVEESFLSKMDTKLTGWEKIMTAWKESTQEQLNEIQVLIGSESKVNARFRHDLAGWLEEQQHCQSSDHSFLFATNLGDMNNTVPLCGSANNSADGVKKRPCKPVFEHWDDAMFAQDISPKSE